MKEEGIHYPWLPFGVRQNAVIVVWQEREEIGSFNYSAASPTSYCCRQLIDQIDAGGL